MNLEGQGKWNAQSKSRKAATAKLQWLRGNSAPYFSLTANGKDNGSEFGGCCHDEILKHWPDLAPLAALHLSDMDGAPMHVVENGFYHLGGTHWQAPKFKVAADHFRISETEAKALVDDLFGNSFSDVAGFLSKGEATKAKERLAAWVDTQRPRWKAEADAAIEQFGLARPDKPE